jgi:hypothetical protein
MAICYTVALVLRLVLPKQAADVCGLGVAVLAGAAKEWIWDRQHPATNQVDPYDFAATAAGGLAAYLVLSAT